LTGIKMGTSFASPDGMNSCGACPIGKACAEGRCVFMHRRRGAGERIYLEREAASSVWFIKAGTVALVRELPGGERVRAIRGEGSFIGLEILVSETYLDTARALTDLSVCALSRAALDRWLGDAATPARAVLEQTVRGLLVDAPRGAGPDGSAASRVARWILDDRGGAPVLPRRVVASMLGMAPETLSRTLAELCQSGAIEATRRAIAIRDRGQLVRAAGYEPRTSAPW
jgi:CRP-like cAMP-binding protein